MSMVQGSIVSPSPNNKDSENATNDTSSLSNSTNISQSQLCAYSMETELNEKDIITMIDNIRFVNSLVVDSCQWFYREVPIRSNNGNIDNEQSRSNSDDINNAQQTMRRLVLVFGVESNAQLLCQAIHETTS